MWRVFLVKIVWPCSLPVLLANIDSRIQTSYAVNFRLSGTILLCCDEGRCIRGYLYHDNVSMLCPRWLLVDGICMYLRVLRTNGDPICSFMVYYSGTKFIVIFQIVILLLLPYVTFTTTYYQCVLCGT